MAIPPKRIFARLRGEHGDQGKLAAVRNCRIENTGGTANLVGSPGRGKVLNDASHALPESFVTLLLLRLTAPWIRRLWLSVDFFESLDSQQCAAFDVDEQHATNVVQHRHFESHRRFPFHRLRLGELVNHLAKACAVEGKQEISERRS